jgi:lambda repressor-like predicted transcriptional regulator
MSDRRAAGLTSLVPDTRARQHAKRLREAGWRIETLVAQTGVSKWTWNHLTTGTEPRRIHVRTEKRILAFAVDTNADRGVLVDSTGTRRRMGALMTQGWSVRHIQARAGIGDHTLFAALHKQGPCLASTRDAVKVVYEQLWDKEPPATTPYQRAAATKRKRDAERNGYAPPMAWDDETIDDPAAEPDYGGVFAPYTPCGRERFEDFDAQFRLLLAAGRTGPEAAADMGLSASAAYKRYYRATPQDPIRFELTTGTRRSA